MPIFVLSSTTWTLDLHTLRMCRTVLMPRAATLDPPKLSQMVLLSTPLSSNCSFPPEVLLRVLALWGKAK